MRKSKAKKTVETKTTVKAAVPQTTAVKEEAVKEVAPVVKEAVVETVEKEEAVTAAPVGEEKTVTVEKEVEAEVKETAKKAVAKKTTTKKVTEKKEELKPEVYIQFNGQEAVIADVIEKAKKQFVEEGHRAGTIKSLQVYLKPEEYAAYYVINQKHAGRVDLF